MYTARMPTIRAVAFLAISLCSLPTFAGQLRIVPTLVEFDPASPASIIRIENAGETSVTIQLRTFQWLQVEGKDKLQTSQDLVVSPPIASIAPGSTQAIRVIRKNRTPSSSEQAFRLMIDELPSSTAGSGVRVLLRYALPVFIAPEKAPLIEAPRWSTQQDGDQWQLQAYNPGGKRVRVAALSLQHDKQPWQPFGEGLVGYILAGQTVRWPLPTDYPPGFAGEHVKLTAQSEFGEISGSLRFASKP